MAWCKQCGQEVEDDELGSQPRAGKSSGDEPAEAGKGDDLERCPSCGTVLAGEKAEEEQTHPKAPWHFKVLVVGSVGYLGYRLYQGIGWLIHHA
ncbi:MAG: hypothetical protein ABSD97_00150 [Acidimicrobiales bacterium]|jgi:hypothetical protein